jgi:exodeoxyribonuclease VII large subunit
LSLVFFRGADQARAAGLTEGMKIEVLGRLTVYEPRGAYQLVVSQLRARGKGDLQRKFEELKAKLREEGLFDEDRKRPVPGLPRCIGVVTSPQGAAIRDFLQILDRRFANVQVRIYPAAVQGEGAAAQIAAGVAFFNRHRACDVIVVTRGGGSLEDLWPFNEEIVARAVAASEIPVISAIGHEVDFTICDFAADLRVPTPSAAAELVIGKKAELVERIQALQQRLRARLQLRLTELRRRVERAAGSYVFREPRNVVRTYQQRLDELSTRIQSQLLHALEIRKGKCERLTAQLNALSPRRVLERGYSILLQRGQVQEAAVTSAAMTAVGEQLRGVLAHGELLLNVSEVRQTRSEMDEGKP